MANLTDVLNFRSNLTGANIKSLYEAEPNAFVDSDKSKIDSLYYIPTSTITANYAAADKDEVKCDSSGGTFTITLPASGSVKIVDIVGVDADTGFGVTGLHVTLVPQPGGTTILGETSLDLDVGASRLVFTLYGSDWKLIDVSAPRFVVSDWNDLNNKPNFVDSSTVSLSYDGTNVEGSLIDGSIDESKLDASVNASLDLADSSVQLTGDQTITGAKTFSSDVVVSNVTIGAGAGNISTNTAFGESSLLSNTTGYENIAIGASSLRDNTTGFSNTSVGRNSLRYNLTGLRNVAIGNAALFEGIEPRGNVAIGSSASEKLGKSIAAGSFVIGQTYKILSVGTTDFTLIGSANNTVGTTFTATGVGAGTGTASPVVSGNVVIGYLANRLAQHGSNNIIIGNEANASSTTASNEISFGNNGNSRFRIPGLGIDWTSTTKPPTITSVPSTATSTGTAGQIAYDTNFIYLCVATNTWRRASLTTW